MPERETRIPSNAKKVFEGVIFDVYHYELEDFNGRIRTFERLKRNDSVLILPVTDDGKIVIARQLQPHKPEYLDCFGGQIDPDELSVDAGRRELLEESGMTAKEMELWFTGSAGEKIDWVLYYYIARGVKKSADVSWDGGEKLWPVELTIEEFVKWCKSDYCPDKLLALEVLKVVSRDNGVEELRKIFFKK